MTEPFRISEDLVPIGKLKARAAMWLRRIAERQRGVVVTQNGEAAAVLLPTAQYDDLVGRLRLLEEIAMGMEQADAGRTLSTGDVRSALDRARRSRAAR